MKRSPEWWERIFWVVIGVNVVAGLLVTGYVAAGKYAAMPAVDRTITLRAIGSVVFSLLLMMGVPTAYDELFTSGDIPLFLTMPLTDRQRFHRKASKIAVTSLVIVAMPFVAFTTFAFRLHWPLRAYVAFVAALLLMIGVVLGIAFVVALSRWLRLVLRAGVIAVGVLLIVQIVALFRDVEAAMARFQAIGTWSLGPLIRWWPGVIAADLLRAMTFGAWLPTAIAAAKLLLMAQTTLVAAEVLATFAYRTEDVLRERGEKIARGETRTVARRAGPLARWLRARWSTRTRELLAFIQRREYPEDVELRLVSFLLLLGIAMALAWLASAFALLGAGIIAMLLMFQLMRDLMHMPIAWRQRLLARRGNHDHPLVETWPISAREFVRVMVANDFTIVCIYVGVTLLAGVLLPVPFVYLLFVAAAIAWLLLFFAVMNPLLHALSYHTDVRRRSLPALLRVLGQFTVMLATAFLILEGIVAARPGALATAITIVLVLSGGALAAYRLVLSRDCTHRFDSEYKSKLAGPTGRW